MKKNEIIKEFMPFVGYVVGRMHSFNEEEKEIAVKHGVNAITNCVEFFDFTKGAKFETYIVSEIKREITNYTKTLRNK